MNVARLNHAIFCLIPKEQDARVIQKYRIISLVNCFYKIISKLFTNRLSSSHELNSR
jgi:hypothetical protein